MVLYAGLHIYRFGLPAAVAVPFGIADAEVGIGAVAEYIGTELLLCRGEEAGVFGKRGKKGGALVRHPRPLSNATVEGFVWKGGRQPLAVFAFDNLQLCRCQQAGQERIAKGIEKMALYLSWSSLSICFWRPFLLGAPKAIPVNSALKIDLFAECWQGPLSP